MIALLMANILIMMRWRWFVLTKGIALSCLKAIELSFIGLFFNLALPGGVSGDFVKAYYLSARAPTPRRMLWQPFYGIAWWDCPHLRFCRQQR